MQPEEVDGQTAAERATALAAEGYEVFNTYGGETGLKAEIEQAAAEHPRIAKAMSIGKSLNGQEIVAVKVTKNARTHARMGSDRPCCTSAAQHAREWITPEMIRRLLHHVLDSYGSDRADHPAGRQQRAVVRAGRQP